MEKLTTLRYYFNKMDNIQRDEVCKAMGVSLPTLYKRLKNGQQMSIAEAKAFAQCVYDYFEINISIEHLLDEVVPQPVEGGES